jgi:hypothetical protein
MMRVTMTAILLFHVGCGRIEHGSHYGNEKKYGRNDSFLPIDTEGGGPEETVVTGEEPIVPEVAPISGETQPPVHQPASQPGPMEPEVEVPNIAPPAEIKIDPNLVVAHGMYRGAVNKMSLRLLTTSGTEINPWGYSVLQKLLKNYDPKPDIKFMSSQTYGDEATGVSTVTHHGFAKAGDVGVMFGDESESGTQKLERVVGDKRCPVAMVCVRSMEWHPMEGRKKTLCYRDSETGKPTLFPYSPAPNFGLDEIEKAVGSMGPYDVERYDGIVNCQKLGRRKPESVQKLYVRISVNREPKMKYMIQVRDRLPADYSVRMVLDKASGVRPMNQQPYVDQSVRIQAESEYFINSEYRSLVKVVKRARKNIKFAGDQSWIGSVVRALNYVSPIDGISTEIHVEFCQNLLKPDQPSACPTLEE